VHDSAGIRNVFRQGIDIENGRSLVEINNAASSISKPALGEG